MTAERSDRVAPFPQEPEGLARACWATAGAPRYAGLAFDVRETASGLAVYARRKGPAGGLWGAALLPSPATPEGLEGAMRAAVAALAKGEARPGRGGRKGKPPAGQRGLL